MVMLRLKNHKKMLEVSKLLSSCDGCQVWKNGVKDKARSHERICKGCPIYAKIRKVGKEL